MTHAPQLRPPVVDILAHLDDERLSSEDPIACLQRAHAAGVTHVINGGTDPTTADAEWLARLSQHRAPDAAQLYLAFGVHPAHIRRGDVEEQLKALEDRLRDDGVVALGECGLDRRIPVPLSLQARVLRAQLDIARDAKLPVIFHVVGAWGLLHEILDDSGPVSGVVHGFTGAPTLAAQLIARGLVVSLGGAVCRRQSKKARATAAAIDLMKLVVETDTPDHPTAGRAHSEPADLSQILAEIAALRGGSASQIALQTGENAAQLFFG